MKGGAKMKMWKELEKGREREVRGGRGTRERQLKEEEDKRKNDDYVKTQEEKRATIQRRKE